uniref:Probable tRNA sulfurtransferase n=1 Tax=uncultured Chloroflexi bacterium HF0200_06I16 TaxID=710735 RepID=E0XU02_9CHLR|nr:thiamine biosynthesis ATP pyrophosphatase [uncultured Chloroflexi bacterium HF0200_06I16]
MQELKSHAIVKTHELALKGKNRPWFMRKLTDNLRTATKGSGVEKVWKGQLMVGLTLSDEQCWPEVKSRLREVFGVAKFYKAYELPQDLDGLKAVLPQLLDARKFSSFRITTNRADKRFPMNSEQVNRDLGSFVKDLTGARVNLKEPELSIYLDIQARGLLVYFEEVKAHGGLPVGVSGKVAVMLSGGIDSPVAAWQMMKRGCQAMFVHFHSYPLVDRTSMEKAVDLVDHLNRHQYESNLFMVPLGEIQKQIILSCPPSYRVVLYRRFMVRITEALAKRNRAKAIVTGESCGQVASQTLENIAVVDNAAGMPILRPLIGNNKEEIVDMSQDIGTFSTSILPDQDCCTLFVPKHPETKADIDTVLRLEETLSVDEMVKEAVENTERRHFASPAVVHITQ